MASDPASPRGAPDWRQRPLDWARDAGEADRLVATLAVRERRQRRRRLSLGAAAAAVLALSLAGAFRLLPRAPDAAPAPFVRAPLIVSPEHRLLPDGTRVELKPGSELAIRFTAGGTGRRDVALLRGEAHFEVTPNPARPFVVAVGSARFRAVGTAFSVALTADSAEMHVTEGRVAVDTAAAADPAALVPAGHRIVVPSRGASPPEFAPVAPAATTERFAWRIPRIEFNETPLAEVVAQLNRQGRTRLHLTDPGLRRIEISGALRADNIEPLLRSLEVNYRIRILRLPNGDIGLEPAP